MEGEEQDQEQEESRKDLLQCMKSWVDTAARNIPAADHPLYFELGGSRKQEWQLVTCSECIHPRLLHNIINKECWRVATVLNLLTMCDDYYRLIYSSEMIKSIITHMRKKIRKAEVKQEQEQQK